MKQKTILLVDDDYLDIVSVQRTLKKINAIHTLHTAHNGEEAINMLKGEGVEKISRPDIILLDINMPKMNGIEFLTYLRGEPEFKSITVFIITTSNEEFDKIKAQSLGISGFIIKPLDFDKYENQKSSMDNFNLFLELLK